PPRQFLLGGQLLGGGGGTPEGNQAVAQRADEFPALGREVIELFRGFLLVRPEGHGLVLPRLADRRRVLSEPIRGAQRTADGQSRQTNSKNSETTHATVLQNGRRTGPPAAAARGA